MTFHIDTYQTRPLGDPNFASDMYRSTQFFVVTSYFHFFNISNLATFHSPVQLEISLASILLVMYSYNHGLAVTLVSIMDENGLGGDSGSKWKGGRVGRGS